MLFVLFHRARYYMPTMSSSGTTKEIFAKARARHKVLHYCAEGLALQCFLVDSVISDITEVCKGDQSRLLTV